MCQIYGIYKIEICNDRKLGKMYISASLKNAKEIFGEIPVLLSDDEIINFQNPSIIVSCEPYEFGNIMNVN